ncbi:hypothetical protein PFICI_05855 [Pestalotiopsis fici W106-1]|uniref:Protein kinase domain-containing protein n=1 Tax=Pestalotiopsis fici (strain W106-1 / CGMCC3.15140) TaxID=1229662 RepID=W3XD88_PESFW|nr:uncharacterized protein PFICI_05855 [Pestalotiopsis fici W106-1]ETS83979.1 hypothetical protein PFICI_05855 [Pestalotiopsis fici W106-1]
MAENVDARPGDDFAQWVETTRARYIGQDLRENSLTYIPYSELTKYWSITKINAVLRSYDKPLPFDAPSIQSAYLRIFSALVWTGTTRRFLGLVLTDALDDHRWPLVDPPRNWHIHNRGALGDFENLQTEQWIFFPYHFEKTRLYKTQLESDCILPIESLETIFKRGESLVHKIKINDDYNGLGSESKGGYLALKEYELKYAEERYQTEVDALTMLRQSPSENLITFYGSFRKDGHGFIILDFADGGDLKAFFQETPPPMTAEDTRVFWKSLIMSLQGLDRIHQLMSVDSHMKSIIQGIHQDIKPANILLMKGSSGSPYDFQPKIADFGLFSHARKTRSNSDEAKGPNKYGNQIYSAPEVSTNVRNKFKGISLITPGADIFSFGAVLSAAAAFVAGGTQLIQEYLVKRKAAHAKLRRFSKTDFEGCFHAGTEKFPVIEEMHSYIKTFCQDKRHDLITPQILDIVQQHMLLPKSSERDQAAVLIDRFNNILWSEPLTPTISLSIRRRSTWMTSSDNGETTPTSLKSIRSINTFFEGGKSWLGSRAAENSKVLDSTVKNLIDQITRNLRDRDQFFFIDDSTSMRPHERIVLEGFQALSSIAKRLDPNRVELAFASRPKDVYRARATRKLVKIVKTHRYEHEPTMMAKSLSELVEHQIIRKLPVKKMGFNINPIARKHVSVYIFTDGNWGDDPEGACHVEDAVKYLMDEVGRRRLTRQQVTLHFVRFGDSEAGGRHLEYLDRFGEKYDCDIVDVKHISSDVESLFVGPLTYHNDRRDETR